MADTPDTGLVDIANQFKGLPMGDLIGGPLSAACDAQVRLAQATSDFIRNVGFQAATPDQLKADPNAIGPTRTASFGFTRPVQRSDGSYVDQKVELDVPLLSIVRVPSLAVKTVDIVFDMEVKSSTSSKQTEDSSGKFSADAKVGWGPFSLNVHVEGAVASHKENTRSSDNSAKYHVELHASDDGMPEGLSRVMDILNSAIVPKALPATDPTPTPTPPSPPPPPAG